MTDVQTFSWNSIYIAKLYLVVNLCILVLSKHPCYSILLLEKIYLPALATEMIKMEDVCWRSGLDFPYSFSHTLLYICALRSVVIRCTKHCGYCATLSLNFNIRRKTYLFTRMYTALHPPLLYAYNSYTQISTS